MNSGMHWNLELGEAGWLRSGRFLVYRAILWATILFAITAGFFFMSILGAGWLHLRHGSVYLVALIAPLVGAVVYTILVRLVEKRHVSELSLDRSVWREVLTGFVLAMVTVSGMLLVLTALGLYTVQRSHWSGALDSLIFDSYISAVLEELAFRAILLRILARAFGSVPGLILSSLLFGLAHLSHATWVVALLLAFNAGLILGLLYMTTGRLWIAMGMHLGWDFTEESLLGVNSHHGVLLRAC